ncbi:MAG: biotin--[acetyl-CoA-carboxylase] ligase [Chloroflexi bacterium]|nr:biotin--[acetyl-CoA-carboxylase] ligase [Chloroflexota bacterium]
MDFPVERFAAGLGTRVIGRRVVFFPVLISTMIAAREEAERGAPEGTVIIAGEQTAAKGRLQRTWFSPRGALAFSVILRPKTEELPYLIMLSALSVVHSIEQVTHLKPQIKWPNDVLIDGKKVCGILIENSFRGSAVDYAIIGIGVNVNIRMANLPEVPALATSLSDEIGREVSLPELLRQQLRHMDSLYLSLGSGQPVYEEWRRRLVTLGQRVRVRAGGTVEEGIAESVAPDGSLLLRRPDGTMSKIMAGDVTLRE